MELYSNGRIKVECIPGRSGMKSAIEQVQFMESISPGLISPFRLPAAAECADAVLIGTPTIWKGPQREIGDFFLN